MSKRKNYYRTLRQRLSWQLFTKKQVAEPVWNMCFIRQSSTTASGVDKDVHELFAVNPELARRTGKVINSPAHHNWSAYRPRFFTRALREERACLAASGCKITGG